ncbi:YteV [Geobacillus thermodenitrificans NG80-2]|uniref:YteV n=15 Tax=Geobacillus TaxID=129337 RepID=A4IRY1_GEOTN|nr:YteV [Geobacillus thermodenitrificans NG80-2]
MEMEKEKRRAIAMYKVKVFDKEHEKDLEAAVNDFLARLKDGQLIDVKYSVAAMESEGEQIYCFSAMVIYRT